VCAQITISNGPFLYRPAENYPNLLELNYTVQDNAHNRSIPILIRFPMGASGQLPVVLWSPGGDANPDGINLGANWGKTIAQAGYIVIHMSHLPRSPAEQLALCNEFGMPEPVACAQSFYYLQVDRPRDASAVLTALTSIEAAFPVLAGHIDLNRVAVGGHSFGSYTAMTLAGGRVMLTPALADVSFSNPLPKIFLAFSPEGPGRFGWKDDSWREITRPVVMGTGLHDSTGGEEAPPRLIPFERMTVGQKYRLYLNDIQAIHETFNLENDIRPEFNEWVASYGLAFLDAKFKNSPYASSFLISPRMQFVSRKIATVSRK
jgi:hypothetical protein